MESPFEAINKDKNKSMEPCSARNEMGQDVPFSNPLFIELIQRIKNNLSSIKNYTQISLEKFSDKAFGEYYYRVLTEDIEKMEIVLNGLVDYVKLQTPIKRMQTVHGIIEEVLTKHQVKLEGKGIKLLRRFEKDLPEAIVPDEQLKYIFNSVLQYAMVVTPPNWNIALSTKSFLPEKQDGKNERLFQGGRKYIEISVTFAVHPRQSDPAPGTDAVQKEKEEVPDILLRLVREVVLRNHGIMKMGTNQERTKNLISLRFPVERRKVVYDPAMN